MASKKQLGIYFGNRSLSLVETNNQVPEKFVTTPHGLLETEEEEDRNLPDEVTLAAVIQKSLRDQRIETTAVNLSLPTKDVIFRSFVIPWMQPSEITGVIEFEARKYIPFKLEELSYTYHTITFEENKTKRIRVLFAAIKKEILEAYCNILEQCGLEINLIEPAPISLIRALTLRKQLPPQQKIAITYADEREGRIIIVDDGTPHFVREFSLQPPEESENTPDMIKNRLFAEIRNSLSYYSRQYADSDIDGIVTLSVEESHELLDNLGHELDIPTISMSAHSILGTSSVVDVELLHAFGAALKGHVPLKSTFDLSSEKHVSPVEAATRQIDIPQLAKTAGVCAGILLASVILSNRLTVSARQSVKQLQAKQGPYESLTTEEIRSREKETREKLSAYRSIRMRSNGSHFLSEIAQSLPKGTWLSDFRVSYEDVEHSEDKDKTFARLNSNIFMELNGYAYDKNPNEQIRQINAFVAGLKNIKVLSEAFGSIDLISAQTQTLQDHTVTGFRIVCR